MTRLQNRDGFPQRFFGETIPTSYLPESYDISEYRRSVVTIRRIREDVQAFGNNFQPYYPLNMRRAILRAREVFACNAQPMLHLNDLFHYPLKIWSSSPGMPWKQQGFRTKRDVAKDCDAVQSIRWYWHKIKNGVLLTAPDCMAFVRSHIVDDDQDKVRAVWGYPMTMSMGEAMYAIPLIEKYQSMLALSPIAFGYETALGGARRVVRDLKLSKHKVALDFKSFDKTVPSFLIKEAFDILALNIDFLHYRDYGTADVRRNLRMYEYIQDYFINTPIRLCDGQRFMKSGGVASGSYFTQLIDSVVNYILVTWACYEQHGVPPEVLKVFGDDSFFGTYQRFDIDDANDLFQSIGMSLNLKKSSVSRSFEAMSFLGYDIAANGMPSKPTGKWFASLYYPEYPDKSWDDVATRALGLLYANGGIDDKFDDFCRHVVGFQPFDLAFSRSLSKFLMMAGIELKEAKPPDKICLWRKFHLI